MTTSGVQTSVASLLLRLGVGTTFVFAGLEKVARGPEATAEYFSSLGVPLPDLAAPIISWFELIGGLMLLLGLATVPLACLFAAEMIFVLLLVRLPQATVAFSVVDSFLAVRLEVLLAAAAGALAMLGPGTWSLDGAFRRRLSRDGREPDAPKPD